MKRIELMLAIGTIAMIALSCARGYVDPSQKPVGGTKTVTLTVNADELSRVGHIDGTEGVDVVWRAGDQVLVVDAANSANTAVFTLQSGENTSLGVFSGTVPETTGTLNVYYPADINTAPISYLLQTQVGDNSMSHFADADLMSATGVVITEANTAQVTMVHHGIIFTIPIVNNTAAEQHIVGVTIADQKVNNNFILSGRVSLAGSTLTPTGASSIDLVFAQTVAAGETATVNVVAHLADYGALDGTNIDIFVHTDAGRHQTTKQGIAMAAGTRYEIGDVEMTDQNFRSDLYLLGNAFETSWRFSPAEKIAITNNDDGIYTWSGPIFEGGIFRFTDMGEDWGTHTFEIYEGDGAIAVNAYRDGDGVPNFSIDDEGLYGVTVNFNTMQTTVSKTADHRFIYPIGNSVPTLWALTPGNYMETYNVVNEEEIVSDRILLTGTASPATGNSIKFTRMLSYEDNAVQIIPAVGVTAIVSGTALPFQFKTLPLGEEDYYWYVNTGVTQNYDIEINYTQRTVTFTAIQPDGISLPAYRNGTF